MMHERVKGVPAVEWPYNAVTLGAPFKVLLHDGVTFGVDNSGEKTVCIKDPFALINAVVRARVLHPRKLSGEEIKFVRRSIGAKSRSVAEFLDMTPEHFSRCESGAKAFSAASEKHFRMAAYVSSFLEDPSAFFLPAELLRQPKPSKEAKISAAVIHRWFLSLKIETVFDPNEELRFEFHRGSTADESSCGNDNGDWRGNDRIAA
ncbi:hypothetical protein [Methylocystis rosea]|uniref:Uncharacterized protein n=1 Tax=Methylocystis rosea TaxID=173366 RepID=A0A3G8M3W0_9HYPH|nr:hypothetical protein [Methylocystis rosea]AZG76334.1 hypothetical protein EHO51_06100 [Methylocystis rosea]